VQAALCKPRSWLPGPTGTAAATGAASAATGAANSATGPQPEAGPDECRGRLAQPEAEAASHPV
jgi:hypothetical protein